MHNREAQHCIIGFRDGWLRLIGIPLVSFLIPIAFFDLNPLENGNFFWVMFLTTLVPSTIYWHMDRGIVIFFRKKFPYFSQYKKRVVLQTLVILGFTLIVGLSFIIALENIDFTPYIQGSFNPTAGQNLLATFFVTLLVSVIYESMYAFDMWKIGITDNERLKKENMKAQLDALKNQVNPHFLFNSLNTLAAIIPENPDKSVEYVEKLSRVYRFVLEIKDKKFITLEEELRAIDAYEFLLKMRFGENIQFSRSIPNEKKKLFLIPLSIQMLIENAIKHNIISKQKPLKIELYLEDDYVVVKNNLQPKKQIKDSTKTGLMNIQQRYSLLSDKKPKILSDARFFIVKLPLISIGYER